MAANKQDCTLSHQKHHGLQGTQQDGGFLLRYGHLILYGSKQTGLHPFSQKASRSPRHTARWRLPAAIWAPHFVWQQTNRTAPFLTKSITVSKAHSKMAAFCCDMGTSFCMAANKQDCNPSHQKHHGLQGTQQDGGFLLRYGHTTISSVCSCTSDNNSCDVNGRAQCTT